MKFQTTLSSVVAGAIVLGIFSLGYVFGAYQQPEIDRVNGLTGKEAGMPEDVDFSAFWHAWNKLNEKHVSARDVDPQEKVWGAIQGLASSLDDPYTVFFPPEDAEIFQDDIEGSFSGVGMEIGMRDGMLTVVAPLKDSPAEKAGLLSGDKIAEIDGESSLEIPVDRAVKRIRGEKGTEVELTVLREGESEPLEFSIKRDTINIPTIETEVKDGVFIIQLYNFSATSPNLFRDALREFVRTGGDDLIIDLRGNPGGYLEAAVDMASWFLPAGAPVVREDFGDRKEGQVFRSKGYNIFDQDKNIVILIDGGSASASEILAGALAEHEKAVLVGAQTFGKGSVQELVNVTRDTSLKLTVAEWLTPNGNSISDGGLTPEVKVEVTREDIEAGEDPQLDAALRVLREGKEAVIADLAEQAERDAEEDDSEED